MRKKGAGSSVRSRGSRSRSRSRSGTGAGAAATVRQWQWQVSTSILLDIVLFQVLFHPTETLNKNPALSLSPKGLKALNSKVASEDQGLKASSAVV